MTFQPAEKYVEYNMVDSLTYLSGMEQVLTNFAKVSDSDDYHLVSHKEMNNVDSQQKANMKALTLIN